MTRNSGYRSAILFLVISALLHIAAPILTGFSDDGVMLAMMLPILLIMIWGLSRGWRWFAYICLFVASISGIVAMGNIWSITDLPAWIYTAIMGADWLAAAALFVALWRSKPDPDPA